MNGIVNVGRGSNNLTFSILNDAIRKHHKELKFLKNEIAQKKTKMSELSIEDRSKIDHHLTECLVKLEKEKKGKLVRKFESLSCNNHKAPNASEITSQLSTDNNLE